ncbi:MAG: 3-deoxy-manno-octulosonate cytidylyltransferase [Sphingobacteriia bacterium]|nr:3-deoxy-manno-octulosonate cytidylyltransferase [Sphingobacteriia bacterium]
MNIFGIIPARYASTRFPGKPLADIMGKSMIRRVYEQSKKSVLLNKVIVATDDQRILEHVESFGGEAVMTSHDHQSGTSRCFEAVNRIAAPLPDIVINIQGDEPFIDPDQINKLAELFSNENVQIATLIKRISSTEELFNPNIVKVVTDINSRAVFFSRSPIPFVRNENQQNWLNKANFYKHIGIYAYRTKMLEKIVRLPASKLETAESLEQLRWIEHGMTIHTAETDKEGFAVDTPDDLKKLSTFYRS